MGKTKQTWKNNLKRGLAFMLVLVTIMTSMTFWPGERSTVLAADISASQPQTDSTGVYLISTASELVWFAAQVNGGNGNINAKLVNDIVMNGNLTWSKDTTTEKWTVAGSPYLWTSIGTNACPYRGTFDGNGKTVTGICIDTASTDQGFFGYTSGAVVKNIKTGAGVIKVENEMGTAGGIVGNAVATQIINCENGCSLYNSGTGGNQGGIAGTLSEASSIASCVNTGYMSTGNGSGGIAGCVKGKSTILKCSNTGYLILNDSCGGIAGYSSDADSTISQCASLGKYLSVQSGSGIIGTNNGIVTDCIVNCGKIEGAGSCNFAYFNFGTVANCYSANSPTYLSVYFNTPSGTVKNCYYPDSSNALYQNNYGSLQADKTADYSDGRITYALQAAQSGTETVWGQTLNSDKFPELTSLTPDAEKVYKITYTYEGKVFGTVYASEGNTVTLPTSMYNTYGIEGWTNEGTKEKLPAGTTTVTAEKDVSYEASCVLSDDYKECKGEGTIESPYLIDGVDNLVWVSGMISLNKEYAAKVYRLTADITLPALSDGKSANHNSIGTQIHPFTGTFDGNGYKISNLILNEALTTEGADGSAAFFGYVGTGAVIKNLSVGGSITTNGKYASGLISHLGNNINQVTISNCYSDVNLTSIYNGSGTVFDGTFGGLVALSESSSETKFTINNCYYAGNVSISTSGKTLKGFGGLVGWDTSQKGIIQNSLAAYTAEKLDSNGNENIARNENSNNITNCYYLNKVSSSAQGTLACEADVASGALTYALQGSQKVTQWVQDISGSVENKDAKPRIAFDNSSLAKVYQLQAKNSDKAEATVYGNSGQTVTLTLPSYPITDGLVYHWSMNGQTYAENSDLIYTFGNTDAIVTLETALKKLDTNSKGEYEIADISDWNAFASYVSDNATYASMKGKTFLLTGDIALDGSLENNISTIGTSQNPFTGVLDGDGHKITGIQIKETLATQGAEGAAALFSYVGTGTTIKNLSLSGTITTNGKFASGLISHIVTGAESVCIEKCFSTVNLISSYSGTIASFDGTFGGLIAVNQSSSQTNFSITNCGYAGKVSICTEGKKLTGCGGIVGWDSSMKGKIKNTLAAYTAEQLDSSGNENIARNENNENIVNCYYLNKVSGSTQGMQTSEADMTSGALTYALQGSQQDMIWVQKINGTEVENDLMPQLAQETSDISRKVYGFHTCYHGSTSTIAYGNGGQKIVVTLPDYQYLSEMKKAVWILGDATYAMGSTAEVTFGASDIGCTITPELPFSKNENGQYQITSEKDIKNLAVFVNTPETYDYTIGQNYVLTADIILDKDKADNFDGIGKVSNGSEFPFVGTFDGNGYKITNLNMVSGDYAGIFGFIKSTDQCTTVISNLNVNGTITGDSMVGAIAGKSAGGIIKDCTADIVIKTDTNSANYCGGIVGLMVSGNITECYLTGTISSSGTDSSCYGGIAGYMAGTSTISQCATSILLQNSEKSSTGCVVGGCDINTNSIQNGYYLKDEAHNTDYNAVGDDTDSSMSAKSEEAFTSGEVAYLLNQMEIEEGKTPIWGVGIQIDPDNVIQYRLTYVDENGKELKMGYAFAGSGNTVADAGNGCYWVIRDTDSEYNSAYTVSSDLTLQRKIEVLQMNEKSKDVSVAKGNNGTVNLGNYLANAAKAGGVKSYVLSAESTLPNGVSLDEATGIISGDVTAEAGNYSFGILVTAANGTAVALKITMTVTDTAGPEATAGALSDISSFGAKVQVTTNESGTCYYAILKSKAAKPATGAQVAAASGVKTAAVSAGSSMTLNFSGLNANTSYVAYLTIKDTAGNYSAVKMIQIQTLPKKKSSVTVGGVKYQVTKSAVYGGTVAATGLTSKKTKNVTIPATVALNGYTFKVTAINKKAFYKCTRLERLTVGKYVITIGAQAFAGDKKLKTINIKSKILKKVGTNAFYNINEKAKIKVPSSTLKSYKKLLKNKGQGKGIIIKK